MSQLAYKFTFNDPRLQMTLAGRMLVRTAEIVGRVVILIAMVLALMSVIGWLRWFGVFLALMVIDRIIHWKKSDLPIGELLDHEKIELSYALSPRMVLLIHHAFDTSRITGLDLGLELGAVLLMKKEIKHSLLRLKIDPREVRAKLKEFMDRDEAVRPMTDGARIEYLKAILTAAFKLAVKNGHSSVQAGDLFYGLAEGGDGLIARLFTVFDIPAE